ncbi:MAG: hypothetical protein HC859_00625 [Bacteroidia bacterium]|nr:hypothetical protein [Bacteroidia bacterium]
MKRDKARIVCPIFETSQYPYQGIGLKLGDPFAVTYKYYVSKTLGIVADFGKTSSSLYNRYYREKFTGYYQGDSLTEQQATDAYLTHKVKADWVGDFRILYHVDASAISAGLKLYAGLGAELRSTTIQYDYLHDDGFNENTFDRFTKSRITYGPQATAGIEYSYFKIPVSAVYGSGILPGPWFGSGLDTL